MSLRARRQALIERTDLHGDAFCQAYAEAADEWLTDLFDQATDGDSRGLALMAVGGYGRAELCPFSDLDVVLLHKGRRNLSATADKIWYPVWDEGITLDHSVRRPGDALDLAAAFKVASPHLETVAEPNLTGALNACKNAPFVLITGSLYLVGEALERLGLSPANPGERALNEWSAPKNPR